MTDKTSINLTVVKKKKKSNSVTYNKEEIYTASKQQRKTIKIGKVVDGLGEEICYTPQNYSKCQHAINVTTQ